MRYHLLAAATGALLATAAHAAPTYAALSLVGDKLDVVTYQPAIGSRIDSNTHTLVPLSQDELDAVALRSISRSLKAAVPGAQVTLLSASAAADFDGQDNLFQGDHVTLPPEIDAAVRREGAATLLLVTKHRGEAAMQAADDKLGSGHVEGIGFYLDFNKRIRSRTTGKRSIGFIAPYAYIDVSLIDVATGTVTRRKTIESGRVIGSATATDNAANAWDAFTGPQKAALLNRLLARELDAAVPALLAGSASPAAAGPGATPPQ